MKLRRDEEPRVVADWLFGAPLLPFGLWYSYLTAMCGCGCGLEPTEHLEGRWEASASSLRRSLEGIRRLFWLQDQSCYEPLWLIWSNPQTWGIEKWEPRKMQCQDFTVHGRDEIWILFHWFPVLRTLLSTDNVASLARMKIESDTFCSFLYHQTMN